MDHDVAWNRVLPGEPCVAGRFVHELSRVWYREGVGLSSGVSLFEPMVEAGVRCFLAFQLMSGAVGRKTIRSRLVRWLLFRFGTDGSGCCGLKVGSAAGISRAPILIRYPRKSASVGWFSRNYTSLSYGHSSCLTSGLDAPRAIFE